MKTPKTSLFSHLFTVVSALCALSLSSGLAAAEAGKTQHLTSAEQVPNGLAKSDWQSIRAAYEAGRHAFQPADGGWQARNPGQQWTTKFDGRGFVAVPRGGGWEWGLELKSYGFAGQERAISGVPGVKTAGTRLTYEWDGAVQEWFVNDGRGLEHGFTVNERPSAALNSQPSTLNFLLTVRGSLVAQVGADGQGVEFRDGAGATAVTYAGLKVWDADGRVLPSRFAAAEGGVRLLVDENGARYPLTIDPVAQQAYLKASQVSAGDNFGFSVAVSGDTVVVGAVFEDSSTTGINSTPNELASAAGAAYVFVRSGTTWSQQAYLKASQVNAFDQFGISVAVSVDTVVVGANLEDSSTTGVNSTPNEVASAAGAAYVFVRSGTTWSQQAYLKASEVTTGDQFGVSVAVSGETVVVGATFEDSDTTGINSTPNQGATSSGAAYVFVRSGTTWSQQAYVKASQVTADDRFGFSVAASGDTVVVGANLEDSSTTGINSTPNELASAAGAAYVFVRSGTTWSQQAYLKASQVNVSDQFGQSVAVSGDTVVVGANLEDSSTTGINSTPNELSNAAGAAYVFVRSGTTWSQQAYLKASQVTAFDQFGWSVAVSGDTVVVGANGEDSSTIGINSTPNEGAADAGAAYVFVRSGTTWSQQAYLKASQVTGGDGFGVSVTVSGNTAVVGANGEDSSTTGINSTPNESALDAGAAYVFTVTDAATSFVVNSTADNGDGVCSAAGTGDGCTLREAIAAANSDLGAETITFSVTGTINLTGALPDLTTNMTIDGPGATQLTVRRDTGGDYSVFTITAGLVTIDGLTISNGRATAGSTAGGIQVIGGSTLNLTNSIVSGNTGTEGGGIGLRFSTVNLTDSVVSGNTVSSQGGGILNFGGTLNVIRSAVSGNSSPANAGGISTRNGVTGTPVTPATTSVIDSTISGNTASFGGGGLFAFTNSEAVTVNLTNTTVANNNSGDGGGIYSIGDGTIGTLNFSNVNITNSTITGNSAARTGGILAAFGSVVTITNGTITNNTASDTSTASGVTATGSVTVGNTIIAANVNSANAPDVRGNRFTSQGFNLIGTLGGVTAFNQAGDQTNTAPQLGALADNGGLTFTHMLLAGSPAIDRGNSALITDQRGLARPIDIASIGNAPGSNGSDIGAVEVGAFVLTDAVSRKVHGLAGAFDIVLPLIGQPGVECRSGGASGAFTVILIFSNQVVSGTASVSGGTGSVSGAPTYSGNTMTINLINVADAQQITLSLANVTDSSGQTLPSATVKMNLLLGDTNGDRAVNSGDSQQTRNRSGQATSEMNFRSDVNVDGAINSGDSTVVRARSGTSLP